MVFEFLEEIFCKKKQKEIDSLKKEIEAKKKELFTYKDTVLALKKEIEDRNKKLENTLSWVDFYKKKYNLFKDKLKSSAFDFFEQYNGLKKKIVTKYPQAKVVYKMPFYTKDGVSEKFVDVRNFIFDFYDIRQELKSRAMTIEAYYDKFGDIETAQKKLVLAIYNYTRKYMKYISDYKLYGKIEYWSSIQDTYYLRSGDCENHANLLMSFFKASGMPAWLFRNTCGMCDLGGHSTVYAYIIKDNKWYHLEATRKSPYKSYVKIPDESKDKTHIRHVWFSFNWEEAYNKFTTDIAKESYKKQDKYVVKR